MQQTDHTPLALPVASPAQAGALAVTLAGGGHRSCPRTEAATGAGSGSATLGRW